jgi:O-antigen ligase
MFVIPKGSLFLFLLLVCLAAWCVRTIEIREFSLPKLPVSLPLLAFWVVSLVSLLVSFTRMGPNYLTWRDLIALCSYLIFFFLLISSLKTEEQANRAIFAVIAAGSIAAVYGICQLYGYSFTPLRAVTSRLRICSTFGNPNKVSHFLVSLLPILFSLFLIRRDRLSRGLLFFSIAVSYTYLLLSGTRAAAFGVLFAAGAWFLLFLRGELKGRDIFRRNWVWLAVLAVALILATITYNTDNPLNPRGGRSMTADRLKSGSSERLRLWRFTLMMIRDHPLSGVGIGNFGRLSAEYHGRYTRGYPEHGEPNRYVNYRTAHNEYMHVWAETGVFGALALLWFLLALLASGLKSVKRSAGKPSVGLLLVGIISGGVAYSVQMFFDFPLHVVENVVLFLTMAALLLAIPQIHGIDEPWRRVGYRLWRVISPEKASIRRSLQMVVALLLVSLTFFITQRFRADMHLQKARKAAEVHPETSYAECQKAASLWPYDRSIYEELGIACIRLRMYDEALAAFSAAEQNRPSAAIAGNKGYVYYRQGKLKEAEEEYKRSIFYLPNSVKVHFALGLLYLDQGMKEKSAQEFRTAQRYKKNAEPSYLEVSLSDPLQWEGLW